MNTTQRSQNPITTTALPFVALHPQTEVGTVTFKVANLQQSLSFYTELIGLQLIGQPGETTATLGAGNSPILYLEQIPNPKPRVERSTGLYHAAILLPTRRDLAIKVNQLASIRYPFGYGDHLVSEAFYLDDPDGNGLELYRDRPRSEWQWMNDGWVQMATDPIDFEGLSKELENADIEALNRIAIPAGTKLGHMHLKVGSIPKAEAFYHDLIGFDITFRMPSALFLSAGKYHHHLGANTWHSANARPAAEEEVGLRDYSIVVPDQAELDRLTHRLAEAGVKAEPNGESLVIFDPFQNKIRLEVRQSANG